MNQPDCQHPDQNHCRVTELSDFLCLLSKFGAVLVYFYICDRTHLSHAINKGFSNSTFWFSLLLILILGLLMSSRTKQTGVNHLDITREWKGWMQLYILVYHFVDGYSVQVPYFLARWCVSAFLFLSGFGHFRYFWRRSVVIFETGCCDNHGDLSTAALPSFWFFVKRYMNVMFRMNFLVVALCFTMNRNYLAYYFIPLVSFWFTVVVLVMSIYTALSIWLRNCGASRPKPCFSTELPTTNCFPDHTVMALSMKYFAMLGLLVISLCNTELLHRIRPLFHAFFHTGLFHYLLRLDVREPDVVDASVSAYKRAESEWYFRWSLDRYSALFGMFFAFFFEVTHQALGARSDLFDDTLRESSKESCFSIRHPTPPEDQVKTSTMDRNDWSNPIPVIVEIVTTSVGIVTLIIFLFYIARADRSIALQSHPYICVLPILSYILFRNGSRFLRSWYSKFFAWFGDISLELFVGQYHIWLAQDGHGLLVFIPGWWSLNVLLTTTMFVAVCHELHKLTGQLQFYILPKTPNGLVSRGVVLFLLVAYFYFP